MEEEKERQKIDTEIQDIEKKVNGKFVGDNIKLFADVVETYKDYVDNDTQWYRTEEKRVVAQTKLNAAAGSSVQALEQCVKLYHDSLTASRTGEGDTAMVGSRLTEQLFKIEDFLADTQELRRGFFAMMAEPSFTETQKLSKENLEKGTKLEADLTAFVATVRDPNRKVEVNKAITAIGEWLNLLEETTVLLNSQDTNTANQAKDSEHLTETLTTMMENLRERVATIREISESTDRKMVVVLLAVTVFAVLCGTILSFVLDHNITVGLKRAINDMQIVAGLGHLDLDINEDDRARQDEIGDMARGFEDIVIEFRNVENLAISLAERNFDTSIKERGDKDTMNINLNKMLDQVNIALQEVAEGVRQVSVGSNEVSSAAQALSSGAQESAASLEEISASMHVISDQTKTNAESAAQARDLAHQASTAATNGQESMHAMTEAMSRITQNSNEIQRVIKVIDDIAFQTNLLALNAAVEAARAGQHGKGFAVVAEEVRNLASRSAKAAQETSELIAKSGQEIDKGGEVAQRTADVLNTIVNQIKQTTDLVAGIATASNEQAQGVNQITIGLQQIDAVTQQNTAAAEESASAANEMSSMAKNLHDLVARFKLRKGGEVKMPPTTAKSSAPAPKAAAKPASAPVKPAAKVAAPVVKAKPAAVAKPVTNPSEPVSDDKWGGGGNAEIQIDLDDKNFGKY
jgi:methyl-accepting chemotaxis protein